MQTVITSIQQAGQALKCRTITVAWKNGYYYCNRRIGGKVVSEYVGGGFLGEFVAQADEEQRQEAAEKRQAWQAIVDSEEQLDAQLDEVTKAVNAYTGAVLLVNGYRQHKRSKWRKKRE
jgi:hypothetical protein